ncbi:putative membrane protein, partial [Vibrio parahaemolyticus VPTS-2010]
AFLQK